MNCTYTQYYILLKQNNIRVTKQTIAITITTTTITIAIRHTIAKVKTFECIKNDQFIVSISR